MNIDETIEKCEISLKQIKQYDPDPFYVNYFFDQYISLREKIIAGIFEEADRDFGLFLTGLITEESFHQKAKSKNDENAIKFSKWFRTKYVEEHKNPYPNFMSKICNFRKKFEKLPNVKIMIRASDRYKDDINLEIKVPLSNEKLRSKEELDIEIKRQIPVFLEVINHKRREKNEPKVENNQIVASTFLDIEDHKNIEVVYASEIYIPVMKRLVEEARMKIKELIRNN
ncbi:hypothetical protein C5F49_08235 [Nitrosopumilus oxyclinae]|uniref:Uncharacterized protein n=1 Tax=Nitrosopumilus oxyclinae TaxID=1959104 RepID=A0A7D5M279_9ARCH|nr:hypothetical protein [Nitrosopumilus oxyclinae]QLH05306.1 hypothetical protein C5F49_08235 [Nitrosopumilus oxyclinae]